MNTLLSILIPTLNLRIGYLNRLLSTLQNQIIKNNLYSEIEIIIFSDEFENTLGHKRNKLCEESKGKYVLYIDDDDMVSDDFCLEIIKVIKNYDFDHICFKQLEIDENKKIKSVSEFSKFYSNSCTINSLISLEDSKFLNKDSFISVNFNGKNILNFNKNIIDLILLKLILFFIKKPFKYFTYASKTIPIKRDIVIRYKYSNSPQNQDLEWVLDLYKNKEIKSEFHIDKILKFYLKNSKTSINRGSDGNLNKDEINNLVDKYRKKMEITTCDFTPHEKLNIIYL